MPKIEVNKVAEIIKKNQVDPKVLRQIVEEMNILTQAEANEEKPPATKKQWVILISDPDGLLPKTDFSGWVLQIPENESVATTQDRIFRAVYEFNTTKKGRLLPPKTVGEALENVPSKHFKEQGVWVKAKTPVLMLRTDNCVPDDKQEKLPFQKLCEEHNATVEIRSGGKSVTIDKDGMKAAVALGADVETSDGRKITVPEMLNEITSKFQK